MESYHQIEEAILGFKKNANKQLVLMFKAQKSEIEQTKAKNIFQGRSGVCSEKFDYYLSESYKKKALTNNFTYLFQEKNKSAFPKNNIQLESMAPEKLKNGAEMLVIKHCEFNTIFGKMFIAYTQKGICQLTFIDHKQNGISKLKLNFPKARIQKSVEYDPLEISAIFNFEFSNTTKLHVKGTPFQIKTWQRLLKMNLDKLTTYAPMALNIKHAQSAKAIGSAVGSNPVAYLIPCHRVLPSTGIIGEYRWGTFQKMALIGWEAAKINSANNF